MSLPGIPRGPGLYEFTADDGGRAVTNVRKLAGSDAPPGRILVNAAALLLGVLDLGLFAVSLAAQYRYIFHAKHDSWPSVIEAVALDAGMIVFSLLALGLARAGQSARTERALIVICALGSAGMNYAAADVSSARSVAAYVMPPVFLAIVTDRVIAVVRRHMLGMEAGRSAWSVTGRAALAALTALAKALLYGLRLVLAPRSTIAGARRLVLLATPLPGTSSLGLALDPVREALDGNLRELREGHESAFTALAGEVRGAQEDLRTELGGVREALRTEASAVRDTVRDTVREEVSGMARAALGPVREDLRQLGRHYEEAAASLAGSLQLAGESFRTQADAVRDAVRTETDSVREAVREQIEAVREAVREQIEAVRETIREQAAGTAVKPPAVDRDAVVAGLADEIRGAMSSGGQWTPAYGELMTRTGYSRSWCEKAVRDARTQVFNNPDADPEEAS